VAQRRETKAAEAADKQIGEVLNMRQKLKIPDGNFERRETKGSGPPSRVKVAGIPLGGSSCFSGGGLREKRRGEGRWIERRWMVGEGGGAKINSLNTKYRKPHMS